MVYANKFIVVIKCNGKILRETGNNVVLLPFGSEYSILLKNLDNRKAVANVHVDGNDVLDGSRIVIDANCETELKGVMINSRVNNYFKFIQKTSKVQEFRGDKIDDGIIRVSFGFERVVVAPLFYNDLYCKTFRSPSDASRNVGAPFSTSSVLYSSSVCSNVSDQISVPKSDEGITVAGSETTQNFKSTTIGSIEDHGTIIIQLKGTDKLGEDIVVPLTVRSKIQCKTCGTVSKSHVKYCPECGTNIQV